MYDKNRFAFFLDIDGTLYSGGRIPMKNRIALKAAREAGHLVFINTARSMGNMPEKVKKLKVDGFICSLGCNIIINGKTARLTTIESDELARIFDILNDNGDRFVFEGEKMMICNQNFANENDWEEIVAAQNGKDYLLKFYDQPVAKIFVNGQMTKKSRTELEKDYVIYQHGNYAEFGMKGSDKASGIKFVQSVFDINIKNCVAVGDSLNDSAMMEYCGISVAMGNAPKAVQDMCDIVTVSADKGGVAQAISEIAL